MSKTDTDTDKLLSGSAEKQSSEHTVATGYDAETKASAGRSSSVVNASEIAKDGEENIPSLRQIIHDQVIEGEVRGSRNFTLRKVLGGDILTTSAVRKQIWVLVIITVFVFFYISNRYSCQKDMIELDQLQDELTDAKYKALSSSSKLTELSRESNVLEVLKNNKDSLLKTPTQPPYIVDVPNK